MARQLSHHSKCFKNHLVWLSVFSVILGMVQSCEVWEYHRYDRVKSTVPRDFLVDLKSEIDAVGNSNDIKIIEMLATQSKSQLSRIVDCYNDCYHRDLIADLKNKLNGKLEQIAVALLTPEMKYQVKLIHDAMVGVESDSCAIIDILCTASKKILDQIRSEYQKMYRSRLTTDLDKHTIGKFKKLIGALTRWSRNENTAVDKKLARSDAQNLNSGRDIFSADRSLMDSILVTGSFARIRQAVFRYHDEYNEYFESRLSKRYDGDVRRALITIVRWSKGKESFFAERLHDSLNSVDSDDHSLIRIIVSNIDTMEPIKDSFSIRYHETLEEAIRKKLSGSYADALILLITKGTRRAASVEVDTVIPLYPLEYFVDDSDSDRRTFNWCYWC